MLKLGKEGQAVVIETAVSTLKWEAAHGGQITDLRAKDELFQHSLLGDGCLIPGLQFVANGRSVRQADSTGHLEILSKTPDRIVLRNRAKMLDGTLGVEQTYEIFPEGIVFCEMTIDVPAGKRVELSDCFLSIAIDTRGTKEARWGYLSREPWRKQDATTVHAMPNHSLFRKPEESVDVGELCPLVSLDLGWEGTRFFSNHVEFLLEDWTSFDDEPLATTRTRAGQEGDHWKLEWYFHQGSTVAITGPWRYRNRWGLGTGAARTRSGAQAEAGVRNNALGCRVAHCLYPYAREGDEWPWIMMPTRQIPEQPPQIFSGVPDPDRADEAAGVGANLMVIHQFWMANPGSNGEPVADYHPVDTKWLASFVDRCHKAGMPVLLYVRGIEMWQMYSSFFEDFLEKDRDGLYVDWASPLDMGFIKCSPVHLPAYSYFYFSRALRKRVGDGGMLIGHRGSTSCLAAATFDVQLGGEVSVRHDELLGNPEESSYYSALAFTGAHLISGNLPDREAFSSQRALGVCAAFGMAGHPFMEPDAHFRKPAAYIKPLWDCLRKLDGTVVRIHNPAYSPTRALHTEAGNLFPSLFQNDNGKALLLITNFSEGPASGTVEVDLRELDVPASAKIKPLAVKGVAPCRVEGTRVCASDLPPFYFSAALIG